jgi:hypothetical protein
MANKDNICYICWNRDNAYENVKIKLKKSDLFYNNYVLIWTKRLFFPVTYLFTHNVADSDSESENENKSNIYSNNPEKQKLYGCVPLFMKQYWRRSYRATEEQNRALSYIANVHEFAACSLCINKNYSLFEHNKIEDKACSIS